MGKDGALKSLGMKQELMSMTVKKIYEGRIGRVIEEDSRERTKGWVSERVVRQRTGRAERGRWNTEQQPHSCHGRLLQESVWQGTEQQTC